MAKDCATSAAGTASYQLMEKGNINKRDVALSCIIGGATRNKSLAESAGLAASITYLLGNGDPNASLGSAITKATDMTLGRVFSFLSSPVLSIVTGIAGEGVGDNAMKKINSE